MKLVFTIEVPKWAIEQLMPTKEKLVLSLFFINSLASCNSK